ncbi:MAG: ABC transporter permease [SAR324 cluster bacterium]|uniref:Transport permease protein n=1 Tax=SAR324 cluster bacterium TaxID=2024889 RepID=A0A2A4T6N8_9DELT|nr:MAG: ABC transporter permease [SAR324 cluster bacterium]
MNEYTGFITLFRKECLRFLKVIGQTIFSPLISSTLYLLIFGVNLADKITSQNGVNYLMFIIPGLIAMGLINNAFQNSTSSIIISKFHGDFQDLKIAPLSTSSIVWAYALAATFRGVIIGVAVAMVGELFYWVEYDQFLPISNLFLLFLYILLGGVTFGFLGLSVAIYAKNFDQVSAVSTFILLPLIYLGGVFFSIETMAPIWKFLSQFNPLLYLINGIRYSFLGVSDFGPELTLPLSIGFMFLTYGIAWLSVKRGTYSRF